MEDSLSTCERSFYSDNLDEEIQNSLPTVNERLGVLRPSRELLEFYRKRISTYDEEHEYILNKVDEYKTTYEEQHKMQWELRLREDEIVELQRALSDMQDYLFQERQHVLRLYAENDRLKIRELEDRKKIQTLLTVSGITEREISYFMKEPPAKAIVQQKYPAKLKEQLDRQNMTESYNKKGGKCVSNKKAISAEEEKRLKDNDTLVLQVEALQAQLAEQTRLSKEQIEALLEDKKIKDDEFLTRNQRDTEKIKTLTEKLHKTQDILYDSTKSYLEIRKSARANERLWMSEKDTLLNNLDACKERLSKPKDENRNVPTDVFVDNCITYSDNQFYIEKAEEMQKLSDLYRDQVIQLEEKMSSIREESDVGKDLFKERCEKMAKRLELMNQRYADLERRRNLEVEGFKSDIKLLRQKLKDVEKKLRQVTLCMNVEEDEAYPDDIDLQILRNTKYKVSKTKDLMNDLKTMKAKVYGLENDLRQL